MDHKLSPYLQESSNTIILLKLKINEHDKRISYLYEHYISDASLGPQFYWDASNLLRVTDVSGGIGGITNNLLPVNDRRWQYIQRHGFVDNNETTISYDNVEKLFSLNTVDASWNYMQDGSAYNIIESKTVEIPDSQNTPGSYHIYIDNSLGDLSTTFNKLDLIDSKVHVATVIWDENLMPIYHLTDERHTALIDKRIHYHLHETVGAHYISGGEVSSFIIGSSTNIGNTDLVSPINIEFDNSSAWNRINIAETVIIDEDLIFVLPKFEKPDGINLDYTIFSRTNENSWKWEYNNYPYLYANNGYIKWDDRGVLVEPSVNYFVNSYILYTNIDGSSRYVIIPGQGQYESLKDAVTETPIKFNFSGFPLEEYVVGWQLTWETSANFSTMPGLCTLAIEPKRLNINPRTDLYDSYKIYHNATGGLQGGNSPDEYWHVTEEEKKAIAILTPDVSKLHDIVKDERWIATDSSWCEVVSGYNTGLRITVFKQQKRSPPEDWKDTGKTENRSEQNTTMCPITPYRVAVSVSRGAFDYSYYKILSNNYSMGTELAFTNPIKSGGNSLVISVPANRSFRIKNALSDITSSFNPESPNGTDNVSGYRNNNTFISVPGFNTAKESKFWITIS